MPSYKVNNDIYDIPSDKVEAFEKQYPDALLTYSRGNDIYDIPASKRKAFEQKFPDAVSLVWDNEQSSTSSSMMEDPYAMKEVPMFDDEPNATPGKPEAVRGFGAGASEGWKGLKAGFQNLWGETANIFTGSSQESIDALNELNNMVRQGKDVAAETEDAWTDVGRDIRTGAMELLPGWMIKGWKNKVLAKADKQKVLNDIREAIGEAGGDVDKARAILEQRAQDASYGDEQIKKAAEKFSDVKPTEGFGAWVGSNVVQMIPSASALIVGAVTKSPAAAKAIGMIGMGGMTAATAGTSMYEARQAGASDTETWKVGVTDGMIEYLTEKLPFDRYTSRVLGKIKGEVAQDLFSALRTNKATRAELEDLLIRANERLGGKLFSKKNLKDYVADMLAEGASEFSAEALQTMTSMMYEEPENYPTINEILTNGWEGAKAGFFMGAILGGASKTMEHAQNRQRRMEKGSVDVALADLGDGEKDVVEVVEYDADNNTAVVLHDGSLEVVSGDAISEGYRFSYEEFEKARLREMEDESIVSGNVADGQIQGLEENISKDIEEIRVLAPEMTESEISAILQGERAVEQGTPLADAVAKYQEDVTRYDELVAAKRDADAARKEAVRSEIETAVGQRFWMQNEGEKDENGIAPVSEEVEEIVYADGRTAYVVGWDDAGNLTLVYTDGTKGFSSRSEITDKLNSGEIVSDTPMGLDEYLESKIQQSKIAEEKTRIAEEHALSIEEMIATHPQDSVINLGTEEEKIEVPIIAPPTKDGVIVQMPDGTTPLLRWEDVAHAEKKELTPKTNAQINQSIVDEYRVAYTPAARPSQPIQQAEEQVKRTSAANPLPTKADGTVDQTALWNKDPERWAEWNDEQRQDGGANSLAYVSGAIAKEQAKIAELQAAYAAESDFDARDVIEKEIADTQARVARLAAIQQGYIAQAEAAVAPAPNKEQIREERKRAALRERAAQWEKLTGVRINLIESEEDLTDPDVIEQIRAGKQVKGWARGGQAYIYLPYAESINDVDETYIHEVVAHVGLKALLGQEEFDKFLDRVWDIMSESDRKKFLAYPGVNGNTRAAADEYVAHMAERMSLKEVATREEKSGWEKIVSFVKEALRNLGLNISITDQEIADLIKESYANLRKNKVAAGQAEQTRYNIKPKSAARMALDIFAEDMTMEEIKTGVANEVKVTKERYEQLLNNPPKIQEGESLNEYKTRKQEYSADLEAAKTEYDFRIEMQKELDSMNSVEEDGTVSGYIYGTEGAVLAEEVNQNNLVRKLGITGVDYAFTANNFYVFENENLPDYAYSNGEINTIFGIAIAGNEDAIEIIKNEIEYGIIEDSETLDSAIEEIRNAQAENIGNNASSTQERGSNEGDDSLLGGQPSFRIADNSESSRDVQDSSEGTEITTITDFAKNEKPDIRFNIATEDTLEEQIRAYANSAEGKKAGWTEEKIESIIKETRDLINAIHNSNTGNEFYDDFAVKDPTIRLDWRDGVDKPIVTWTRANIEYKYDMSADLLCINNEGLEAVLSSDKMVALMEMFIPEKKAKKGEPDIKFTADDYLELYNTLKDLGFVVPCKGCFDAAGRFKMLPSVAQKFAAEVNAVIAERNKDPKKFDEKLKAKSGEKTASGLPATSSTKSDAIAVGVAGDNLTEPIKWTQLMSADGQTKMLSDWGGIFRAWQRTGAGRPKDKLLPEPYYGDIVSSHTTIIGAYGESTPSFRDILVNTGTGLRRNSHSEFRPVLAVDEIQFMRDAFIRNLTVFKYMKELDDVRLFGKMGVKYNMSFFPEYVPGTKAAGLDLDGNYIASEESVGSREFPYFDERGVKHYDGMRGFEEAQKHINKDVSLSSVILSIPHLLKSLTDVPTPSDMRGIWGSLIPFHSSGATSSSLAAQGLGLARANGVGHGFEEAMYDYGRGVTNFEAVQNDRFGKGWEIISGKKAGTKVEEGHKLEFANGTHYYNRDLGVHLFASGYILDSELPEGVLMENGDLNIDAEQKKSLMHKFKVDYNDKVRELATPYAYKEAADFYLSELPKIGLVPRFDFTVEEPIFLQMCADANVDPRHPKLGWKGEGNGWSPIDSEAYYSLFCDFGMTDPATGEWSPHNPVGVINENGEREFRLPENAVEIVREGLERFSEVRRAETGKINDAIKAFAQRSVEKGRISKKDAEKVVGELRMRVSSEGPVDLVEEARKAQAKHDAKENDVRFRFIGKKGAANLDKAEEATKRLDNLTIAKKMEKAGKDARDIKFATGWERGADKLWRYEEPDFWIEGQGEDYLGQPTERKSLSEYVDKYDWEYFVKAYPELSDLQIEITEFDGYGGGYYDELEHLIVLRPSNGYEFNKGAIMHEVQHAIQEQEGFASGAHPEMFADEWLYGLNQDTLLHALRIREQAEAYVATGKYKRMGNAINHAAKIYNYRVDDSVDREESIEVAKYRSSKELIEFIDSGKKDAERKYLRTAGEVEARNVEERYKRDWGNGEYRYHLAVETEDIARKDQIFIEEAFNTEKTSTPRFRITPEQDKAYMDAVKAGDMEAAQRMVDEAAAAAGYTIRGDHGRVSKFTIFDRDKANPEGNWGQGFYFTNNEEDVENNYASVEGPDLEAKIEREVEKRVGIAEMNEEFNGDGEVDEFAIREEVEKEFITSEPNIVHAAIKMDKPFVVGHGMVVSDEAGNTSYDMQETYLDVEYEYDEDGEIDYYSEPTGTLIDLIDALNEEISNYDWANFNANEILQDTYDGMTASQFESAARELLNSHTDELVNERGDVMTSEILRAAIERAGFDGIIDNTVNQKFGTQRRYGQSMAGMDSDTRHYISFDSSNIKDTDPVTYDDRGSVIPLSERFNPENQDIRFRVRGENESAEEFIATEIPRFQGSYNVNAPIVLMDYSSKESAARSLGIDVKDMPDDMYDDIKELAKENGGAYVKELNTIVIFAQDNITTSGKADNVFFHEGTHSFITENPHWLALGEWLLDNAASETKKKIADVVRMAYEEDEYVEEMLTSYTGLMLSLGRSQAVMNSLPTEMKPIWEEILNKFNYIPEYEDTRRKSERAGDEDARRDAGVPVRNTDGEKAVRKGKISWKQPAGLTSKERRVINEYFPGAFRVVDSNGNTLTPAQEEFFANSKAVDKDGNLLVLYHGTPRAGFTEFESGWFTTSKEDAISYSGDRKGRMFDPNEKYEPETLVAGDFPLGYMTFDSEEDRAAFLAEYPEAESAMSESEFDSMTLQADEEYDDLIARKPELKKIWNAYREYERERFVDTTIRDIISNPEAYTEEDLMRAMLVYDSNASLDSLDDMDAAERKDALVSALQNANEETEGGILDMVVATRVPRNGEGVKHNDLGNRTYEVYANVENPYEIDANGRGSEFESGDIYKSVEEALTDEQYDGVIIRNWRVGRTQQLGDVVVPKNGSQIKLTINENPTESNDIRFSIRTKPAPKKTGIGYKVFYLKDGKLYPPMVANLGGVDTPVGVWLDAEEGTRAGVSKTGRPQVKQGGKGTQGGSGTLAYRPGWHLGEIPYAIQFNRKDENGDRTLFPADFVWAEVEYANDVDYQEEAMSYGMNANGKFQHSLAGLPKLPTDGSYKYRTNPNPETDPWIITGAMKVNRLLTPSEVDQMVIDAGREPQKRQEGAVTDEQIEALNESLGTVRFSIKENLTEEEKANALQAINRRIAEVHQNKEISSKSNPVGNPAEPLNNEYSPANTGAQGVSLTAKQAKKLVNRKYMMENLADFITDFPEDITLENFAKRLFEGLGLNANNQESDYVHYLSANKIPETIRLSNHSGNSRNIIVKGVKTSKGYSIVIRLDDDYDETKKSNHLDANKWADVDEFVYIAPDRERMQEIAKTLFNLLDVDEYVDLAKAEKHYISPKKDPNEVPFRVTGTPTEDVVAEGVSLSPAQLASLAGDIFAALPEESRKKITDGLNGNILGLQDAILQIPTSLATKEDWNDEDREMAEVVAEQMTKVVGKEMTRPFSASEALWTLYNAVNKPTDLVSEASRALVRRNLGFDSQTLEMENDAKDGVRFRTVGNASANAQASMYNRGAANVWTRLKESYVDMHASVEEFVKAIEKRSGKVAQGFENILMALNQQSSKGLAAMEAYEQKFLNKMFDAIRKIMDKTNFKYEDIVRYVILKHGLERNIKLAQRDAKAHYQEIYDEILSLVRSLDDAQKRTYLTNAHLKRQDALAKLATLKAVDATSMTEDEKAEHKKNLAKAHKAVEEAEQHLFGAEKVANLSEAEVQKELDDIFKSIESGKNTVFQEMRKNDYSGISSMFYDTLGVDRKNFATEEEYQSALMQAKADKYDNLGDIEGAAQMEVALFEKAVNTDNLWKRINAATKETLRQQYDANMISKDQYLNLRDMFEYYVPLRGFKDNTAEDMYTYYRRPNSTGYTKPILGAEGRKTEAESPFGWIAAMAGSAIASNVKNEAKLALYYFVANRPDNGIATLSKTWFVHTPGDVDANGKKIFRPAYPSFNADLSTDAAKQAYEDWQEQMRDLQKQGLAYESGQRLNLGNSVVNISDTNKPEHIVNVKVGGKDYTIVINGNPRAAQAINGDLNIESSAQDYSSVFGPMLRWMSSVNTSYNPEFWITNMMRDMAFTMMAVNIKEDPAYRRKFFKNYAKAFKVVSMVAKNEKGTLGNSYIEQQYKDFVKYGGVTGYTQIKDSETWEKEIENYLTSNDPASIRSGKAMRGMKTVFHAAHRFGESLEQVSRFAAFLTAVETGKSINEAINDAKEITMNFNRKGSGKMITLEEAKYLTDNNGQPLNKFEQWAAVGLSSIAPLGRRFIMFFNAAIQGLNATYKLYAKNKTRAIGWALGYAAVGMMNAVLHAMLDDDDDYLDIPQYERRNSLMIGGNGAYFKWALPQEARAFYALGDLAVESVMGRNPHQNVIGEALKISTEILPVNPSKGWKAFMPSVAIPFVELALNEDYKGAPIYNEQKWLTEEERERSTKWSKAYQGTGDLYVGIAKGLNAISGGDEHDAGRINIQPEKVQHLVQSAFGGTIRTADKLFTTIMAAFDPEEDVTIRQTPFLNRFLTINDERFKNVHVNDVYDYYAAEAEHTISLQKKYTKDRNADALKDLRSSDEYKWARIYSKYKKPIKKYQEAIRAADTTNERMELMKQQDELKRKMIKEISEL